MKSERTTVRRHPERASYDSEVVYAILDAGWFCHVGIVVDEQPYVLPVNYARSGDTIYLHGAPASRLLRHIGGGAAVCITVTHVDGLVVARSAFNHSVNFRSAVVLGHGRVVEGAEEKRIAFRLLLEQALPGRASEVPEASEREAKATLVVAVRIEEASAKTRTGPPGDSAGDHAVPVWAGVLPLSLQSGEPIAAEDLADGVSVPPSVARAGRR